MIRMNKFCLLLAVCFSVFSILRKICSGNSRWCWHYSKKDMSPELEEQYRTKLKSTYPILSKIKEGKSFSGSGGSCNSSDGR